jgi:hypothetical protein
MRIQNIYIIILFLFGHHLSAQTIITGVVSDSASALISNASVYISKTTIGTTTDKDGTYSISISQHGEFELTASFIGYKSRSVKIYANGQKQIINMKLFLNTVLLNEVSISSKEKNRTKNYAEFIKLFIGETENAQDCRIANPGDLHLYRDPENNYIKGFSVKPLRIDNKALGYTIMFDLVDFNYDLKDSIFKFSGYSHFQPMKGTLRNNKKWTRNRLIAYYGSRMHFLRSLFSDSLNFENFKIYDNGSNNYQASPAQLSFLKSTGKNNCLLMFNKLPLSITYHDNHAELANGILGFQPHDYESKLVFSDTLKVFPNGYYDNPYSITWTGAMSADRVADMLPFDFFPYSGPSNQSDSVNYTSPVEKFLEYEQRINSEDQVFLQTDRNKYKPGDTIYFQSYVRNSFSWTFESASTAMYVLLFNDQNHLVDSSRFRITNAMAPGWLALPFDAIPGIYHLIAFTSYMQNFDPADAFHLDLKVDAPQTQNMDIEVQLNKEVYHPGDTLEANLKITRGVVPSSQQNFKCSFIYKNNFLDTDESKTNRNGESFIRFIIPDSVNFISRMQISLYDNKKQRFQVKNFRIPFSDEFLDLRFLPEAGNLIAGLPQVIGFNAVDRNGEPVEIVGLLKNSNGDIIDTIKSGPFGPGKFLCRPEKGMYVEIITGEPKRKISLPVPDISGICMSIKPVDSRTFVIEIQSDLYKGDTLVLSGTMSMKQAFENKFTLDRKQRFVIKTEDLPAGIIEVTLFDKSMKPIAERLVSVNSDKHLRVTIKTDKSEYSPGQEAEIKVNVTDTDGNQRKGFFSISVTDSSAGRDPELFSPGIEFTFNYNPHFPGNLPSGVLEKGLENLPDEQRDLILMTYGWCKFNWDFAQADIKNKELINYDQLNMKLLYASKKRLANRKLDLISLEGPNVMHLKTDKTGEISLPLNSLPDITRSVTMLPDTKSSGRITGAMLSIPYNEQFMKNGNIAIPQKTIASEFIHGLSVMSEPLSDKTIELQEVKVVANRKIEFVNKYEELYKYANLKSLTHEQLAPFASTESAIRRIANPYLIQIIDPFHPDGAVYLRQSHSLFGPNAKALFVLDGMPLHYRGWQTVSLIHPDQIASISVLNGMQGHVIYGEEALGGVIFVNTYKPDLNNLKSDWKAQDKKNGLLMPINIFRTNIEFYNPTMSDTKNDASIKGRATVYWNPKVYFDGQNPVKIKYLNPDRNAKMEITINGVSVNNLCGSGNQSYFVRDIK